MRHKRILFLLVAAALALPIVTIATPAGAIVNSCTIGEFSNLPASQSELKVNCTLTTASAAVGLYNKIEDFSFGTGAAGRAEAVWHVGAGRTVVTTAATVSGGTVVTASGGHFTAADLNNGISGTGIAPRSFIKATTATTATLNIPTSAAVPIGTVLRIENSDGRSVTDAAFPGGATITSATAHFCKVGLVGCGSKSDIGRNVGGTRIQHGTTIIAVASTTSATMSLAAVACPVGIATCGTVDISPATTTTTHRFVEDVTTSGASLCSVQAKFAATDLNLKVLGGNVPAGRWITAVSAAGGAPCAAGQSRATMNAAATANTANNQVVIGETNATAPANGDAVSQLGAELTLNPSLVAGSQACTANAPTGFQIQGKWLNPSAFDFTVAFGTPATATLPNAAVIAQLVYPTAAGISFSAMVQQIPASLAGETATAPHYDITYPLLPTALALCPAPNAVGVGAVFRFNAISLSQSLIPTGNGTPSTAQIRALQDLPAGTPSRTTTARLFIRQANGTTAVFTPPAQNCVINYPGVIDFHCGS
jgi:hypothetical protein